MSTPWRRRDSRIGFESGDVPAHTHEALVAYIEEGVPLGGFTTALMSNDLMGAYQRADEKNLAAMGLIVSWVYNNAPSVCYGSAEAVKAWIGSGGMHGRRAKQIARALGTAP